MQKSVVVYSGSVFALVLFFFTRSLFAQLTITEGSALNMTPQELVENYLVGSGITVSNATYNGSSAIISSNQIGTYETEGAASVQLGLSGGVIMTSGRATIAIGPNNSIGAGSNTGGGGDPDLNIISGTNTFDKAVIEFDFIPEFDTVRFRYVFGSEEFFEYCNSINDAFGFFISGPGINGTFSNNSINIALMPGTLNNYVTINNICADIFSRWDNANGLYFQYDALTHVFTASVVVQPCSTYHIKLAIADAVDHILDSGVFLEENSFSSLGVTLDKTNTNPNIGNIAVEGCNDVTIHFLLSGQSQYPYPVYYTIEGTAVNGVDYELIPDSIVFPPWIDSLTLVIRPLLDLTTEGKETIILTIDQISCNGSVTSDTITIQDYLPMYLEPLRDTVLCYGEDILLKARVSDGYPPYTYLWNTPPVNDSLIHFIPPPGNNEYWIRVTDLCTNSISDTAMIVVHPEPVAYAGVDEVIPNGTSTTLHGEASGGYGAYGYSWTSNPPGFQSSQQNPSTGNLSVSTIFHLRVTDLSSLCISDEDEVIVAVSGGPLSVNPVADPPGICLGSETQLFALSGGGSGFYTYEWASDPPGFSSQEPSPFVSPNEHTVYYLTVRDGFNQMSGNVEVFVYPLPQINLGPPDTMVCIYDTIILDAGNPGSSYEWSTYATTRSIHVASAGIGYEIQPYSVSVTNKNGCIDSARIQVVFSFGACAGIYGPPGFPKIILFPNPCQGVFNLKGENMTGELLIEVYNFYGVQVFRREIAPAPAGCLTTTVDLTNQPKGLYFVRLKENRWTVIRKISCY